MVDPGDRMMRSRVLCDDENSNTIEGGDFFCVRLHHGGKFIYHPFTTYMGGEVEVVKLNMGELSMKIFDTLFKSLGYKTYGSYYYCIPGSMMAEGLTLMSTDEVVTKMAGFLHYDNKIVDVYCKHSEEYQSSEKNVEVDEQNEGGKDDGSSGYSDSSYEESDAEVDDSEWNVGSKEADNATKIGQNDTERGNEDEALAKRIEDKGKAKEVDGNEQGKNKRRGKYKKKKPTGVYIEEPTDMRLQIEWNVDSEYDDDSDGFQSARGSDYDEDDPRYLMGRKKTPKFKTFNPKTDMEDPKFELGMEFTNSKEFRCAVRAYSIKQSKGITFAKNEKLKVSARCKEGCEWYIYASQLVKGDNTFRVRTLVDNHSCSNVVKSSCVNSTWIGDKYTDRVKLNPTWEPESFFNTVGSELHIELSRSSAYRAMSTARKNAEVSLKEQYGCLMDYKEELLRSNPGTSVEIQCDYQTGEPVFKRMYICLGGVKKGFLEGCRKVIGLDGCFLKGPVKGMILSAVGVDANNGMYPLAYAVVEGENKESWTWFLEYLLVDINCENSFGWTFISDKQKGLVPSLEALVPNAEIRFCVKHLHDNFKLKFRGNALKMQLYACAKATYVQRFNYQMEELKKMDASAYEWLIGKEPAHWSRAFFSTSQCCDILLNNLCETFNSCILKARSQPILDLLEWIRMYMMSRLQKCREKMRAYQGVICPRIVGKLDVNKSQSHGFISVWAGVMKYQVRGMYGDQFVVDLNNQECSCRKWQLSGIPCPHAISALNLNNLDPDIYIADWYRKDTYMKSYENMIYPMRGRDMWPESGITIHPPVEKKMPGRPRKRRIRQLDEAQNNPHKLRKYQNTVRCSICKEEYHNARSCPQRPPATQETPHEDQREDMTRDSQLLLTATSTPSPQRVTSSSAKAIKKSVGASNAMKVVQQKKAKEKVPKPLSQGAKMQKKQAGNTEKNSTSMSQDSGMMLQPGQRMTLPTLPNASTTIGDISVPATSFMWRGKRCVTMATMKAAADSKKNSGKQ